MTVAAFGSGLPGDGRDWQVRPVTGMAARKAYRCPGCDHEIPAGRPHVVAWPDDDTGARRHWHTPCWRRAVARAGSD